MGLSSWSQIKRRNLIFHVLISNMKYSSLQGTSSSYYSHVILVLINPNPLSSLPCWASFTFALVCPQLSVCWGAEETLDVRWIFLPLFLSSKCTCSWSWMQTGTDLFQRRTSNGLIDLRSVLHSWCVITLLITMKTQPKEYRG